MRWVLIIGVGLLFGRAAQADDPMPITSDTPAYCLGLADRMEQAGNMPPQVKVLWQEGRSMCQRGHIRGGLARLRRAIMISRGDAE